MASQHIADILFNMCIVEIIFPKLKLFYCYSTVSMDNTDRLLFFAVLR